MCLSLRICFSGSRLTDFPRPRNLLLFPVPLEPFPLSRIARYTYSFCLGGRYGNTLVRDTLLMRINLVGAYVPVLCVELASSSSRPVRTYRVP